MAEFIETAFLSRKNSDGVQPALGLYSVESVLVLSVMPLCSSASSSPFSINISSFFVFLFFGKGKGLYAQSVHSLNFMLSKHPPFNLPSLCLGYYLQSLSLFYFLLHFLLVNYPAISSVYLCRCSHTPLAFCWFCLPVFRALGLKHSSGMAADLVVCALGQHSYLGSCVLGMTALLKAALSPWRAWGWGPSEPPHLCGEAV